MYCCQKEFSNDVKLWSEYLCESINKNSKKYSCAEIEFLKNKKTKNLYLKNMILGYLEMSTINLGLSELGFESDVSSLEYYEGKMANCE